MVRATGFSYALWLAAFLALAGCARARPPAAPTPHEPTQATRTRIQQAEAAERQRRYDTARARYLEAKREAPDVPSRAHAARSFGRALVFWGEYSGAEAELAEAARLEPGDAGTWHDLGVLRHQLGDMPGAETALGQAVTLAPHDGRPRIALAALLWKLGRLREALGQYEALARMDLPERVHAKVLWAIDTLRARLAAEPARTP